MLMTEYLKMTMTIKETRRLNWSIVLIICRIYEDQYKGLGENSWFQTYVQQKAKTLKLIATLQRTKITLIRWSKLPYDYTLTEPLIQITTITFPETNILSKIIFGT